MHSVAAQLLWCALPQPPALWRIVRSWYGLYAVLAPPTKTKCLSRCGLHSARPCMCCHRGIKTGQEQVAVVLNKRQETTGCLEGTAECVLGV